MKRLDDGKVTLVEFISSIKFPGRRVPQAHDSGAEHFARLEQQARPACQWTLEDYLLVRSAN